MAKIELPRVSEDIEKKEKKIKSKLIKVNKRIPELEKQIENDKKDLGILNPEYEHVLSIAQVLDDKESIATARKVKNRIDELTKSIETSTVEVKKLKEDQEKLTGDAARLKTEGDKGLFLSLTALLWSYRAASVEEKKDYSEEISLVKEALRHNSYTMGPHNGHQHFVKRVLRNIDMGK